LPKIYLQKDFVDIELASYPGWTFDPNEDYVNIDDDATGLREHGTQVAQVAAATTNNAYGIAGVGWNTPLVLVRCGFQATNPQGTTVLGIEMDDIINAVNWIRTSSNAKILNISLGWTYSPSSILDAALTSCMNAGIVVVASAGNSSGAPVMYPAQCPGVIAVSGTNSDDINSHYCAGSQLSVVAPANGSWVNISGSISSGAGTSLAAPLVSGAIALLLSQNPNLTPALVKKIIEVTAVKVPGMNGQNFHNYYGYGLLDVYEALRATNSIYTFTNKVMSSGYGSLIIDNDKVNPVPTGSKVPFKYGTLHQSRTNELPFLVNYSGTTQKFNMWYGNNLTPDYNLQLSFTADNLTPAEKDANFIATAPVTIKNIFPEVGALNPANDNISFKDPWYFNKDNNNNWFQTNQYYQYPSPLEIQNNSSSSYGGVFLDQPYTGNNPIYYSVQAISPQDIALSQTGKTHRFYFRNWSGTSVNFQNENNPSTGVVFNYDNAVVNANFKGTQLSNQETGIQNPSQRKFVRTTDGTLHFVYESMNRIWYEISTDNGATWRIMNNATPLETVDSKLPSIDCYSNSVAIVYQKKNGNYYDIVLKSFVANGDDYSGDVTTTVVTEAQELYTTDANPAIALGYNGKGMIVWEKKIYNPFYSTYKGLKVKAFSLGSGSYTDYYTTYLQTTNEYSVTPAIVTIKEDNGTNYYCIAWSQQEPANNTSEIKYNELYLNVNNEVIHRYTPNPQTPSSGCGYTRNYQPVVTNLVQTGVQNAKLSWMGERVIAGGEFEKVKSGEKKGMDKTNVVFDRKAMFKSKDGANWYYYTWGFGNSPVSTSNNSTLDGNYVVGWCENSGQYNKYVRCTTLSQIKDFGIGGKYLQINNGAGFSSLYGKTEKGTDVSGFYYFTQSDNVGSIGKEGANRIYTGREGVIYKGDTEFYFRIGDITVDDETVEFEEIEEGVVINSNSVLNQFLTTKPFMVSSMSDLYYGVQYGVKNGEEAGNSLTGGSFVKFRVELTDGISGEVIGVFDEVNYSLGNLGQYNKIGYKVNTEGIGERTIKIRLVTEDNIGGLYSVTTNYSDLEEFSKASYQEISYRGSLAVKDYALNQNYPNPFNPGTVISYQLVAGGQVSLKVYDILGNEIVTLVDKDQESGRYQVTFDASKLASGVYICRIIAGDFVKTIKMSLVK